jgi:hypothetical protein
MRTALLVALAFACGAANAAPISWTKFRDPKEGAFTIDVPQGWSVEGGLLRRSINQPHPVVVVLSPDKLTKVIVGDPAAIGYAELTQTLRSLGMHEGQSYTPHGEPEIIENYRTGEQWSQHLAEHELTAEDKCTSVKKVASRQLPPTHTQLPAPQGVEHRDTAGETYLAAVCNRILYVAYGFSETGGDYYYMSGQIAAGAWTDDTSTIVVTPQGNGPQGIAIAAHMLKSIAFDQAWWERNFHAAVASSRAIYDHAMNMMTSQATEFDRDIRGVEAYTNPQTGAHLEVPITGADNVAQNSAGTVIGFMGSEPPPGFVILGKGHH